MEFLGKHSLVAHPNACPTSDLEVTVEVRQTPDRRFFALRYVVEPGQTLVLSELSGRHDGLWRSTCFEVFTKADGSAAYQEFNFAPIFAWNAYQFDHWRSGMKPLALNNEPHLVDSRIDDRAPDFPDRYELSVILSSESQYPGSTMASLAAVIEERDGTKSYWALAHPPGETPNFHHLDCFVASLPPVVTP